MDTTIKKTLRLLVIGFIAVLALPSCNWFDDDDDDDVPGKTEELGTIVDIAAEDGRFTTLVAALDAAGLVDDLSGDGPFTVFAPTDDAFNKLPPGTVATLLEPANQALLIDILTYHVYSGRVFAANVVGLDGTAVTMLNGDYLRIDVMDNIVKLNMNGNREAQVIITDIEASNGVIHVIDTVLDPNDAPASIVDTAVADGRFTTLVAALDAAGLVDDLSGNGPFTVFAPTDDAFNALPPGTVATLLLPANQALLIDILTYHVYIGSALAEDVIDLDGGAIAMLNGGSVAIDLVGNSVVLNTGLIRPANVIITDLLCSNGVIHVIDAVLDPEDSN